MNRGPSARMAEGRTEKNKGRGRGGGGQTSNGNDGETDKNNERLLKTTIYHISCARRCD